MLRTIYKSKIQKATVTQTRIDYEGSIGIDAQLMQEADILPNERVQVLNLDSGVRFETYVIQEKSDSGTICLYGPAAHLAKVGDRVFIISYCILEDRRAREIKPKIVHLDEQNKITKVKNG